MEPGREGLKNKFKILQWPGYKTTITPPPQKKRRIQLINWIKLVTEKDPLDYYGWSQNEIRRETLLQLNIKWWRRVAPDRNFWRRATEQASFRCRLSRLWRGGERRQCIFWHSQWVWEYLLQINSSQSPYTSSVTTSYSFSVSSRVLLILFFFVPLNVRHTILLTFRFVRELFYSLSFRFILPNSVVLTLFLVHWNHATHYKPCYILQTTLHTTNQAT